MRPPIYSLAAASSAVLAVLGSPVPRFHAFGNAPQPGSTNYKLPYAVWRTISGTPENYINQRPDMDNWVVQVDSYSASQSQVVEVSDALSYALEGEAHITNWNGDDKERETGLFWISFTVEFKTPR